MAWPGNARVDGTSSAYLSNLKLLHGLSKQSLPRTGQGPGLRDMGPVEMDPHQAWACGEKVQEVPKVLESRATNEAVNPQMI